MARGLIDSNIVQDIENAIKYKLRTTNDYSPPEMHDAIMNIPQNVTGTYGEKTIRQNGIYNANDDFFDGYNRVRVEVQTSGGGSGGDINLLDTTFTSNGTYIPPEGYDGFFEINVNVPEKQYNSGEREFIQNGEYFASTFGYDGFSKVTVNVPSNNYSFGDHEFVSNGSYNANDFGFDGFNHVNINVPPTPFNKIDKEFTANGLYYASTFGADGFNSVRVNLNIEEGEFVFGSTDINENGEFFANNYGYDGFTSVNVNVKTSLNLQDIDINSNGNYIPNTGFDGFFNVNVNVPANVTSIIINENGNYNPPSGSGLDGYNNIFVSVPAKVYELDVNQNGVYTPNTGFDGFNSVNVQIPEPMLIANTFTSNGVYTPNAPYVGFSSVNVQVPSGPSVNIQDTKTITLSDSTTINPDPGFDAMAKVIATVTHPPLQDQKTLSVSYGTTTINPDGTNVAMKKVVVTTPAQPTFGTRTFTTNGLYNANSYGFDGFNQVNVQVPAPSLTTKSITSNGTYTPTSPYVGFSSVSVSVPARTTTGYFTSNGIYTVPTGYDGYSQIQINVPSAPEIDWNNCVYYNNGTNNVMINHNVAMLGGWPICGMIDFKYVSVSDIYMGNNMVDGSYMFFNIYNYSTDVFSPVIHLSPNIKSMAYMFSSDSNFNNKIEFSAPVTGLNCYRAFSSCYKFNSVLNNISQINGSNFSGMFTYCTNFNLPIPNIVCSSDLSYIDLSRMFADCTNFDQKINVYLPNSATVNMGEFLIESNKFKSDINIYLGSNANLVTTNFWQSFQYTAYSMPKLNIYFRNNLSSFSRYGVLNLYDMIVGKSGYNSSTYNRLNIYCSLPNIFNCIRDNSNIRFTASGTSYVYNILYNVYIYNSI